MITIRIMPRIRPRQADAMENLGRYIIQASFSQERLSYDAQSATVVNKGKDGSRQKTFEALEWLAAMCAHVPDKGEQMLCYYSFYSSVSRGKRQRTGRDGAVACILGPQISDKTFRKNWAGLIHILKDPSARCAGLCLKTGKNRSDRMDLRC